MRAGWWITALSYGLVALACCVGLRWLEPVRVAGGSMKPALCAGDLALVSKGEVVAPDDIVLFRPTGHGPVLHRAVEVLSDGTVLTKGDANATADLTPVSGSHVVGPVVAVLPFGRMAERWR